jgi:hypothetical protein
LRFKSICDATQAFKNELIWWFDDISKKISEVQYIGVSSKDDYLVLSTDENFIDNVRYLPLIKKDNDYTSDLISVENYQYFKLQDLKQQV